MPALIEVKVSKKEPGVQWRYWSGRLARPWTPLQGEELELNFNGFEVLVQSGSTWGNHALAIVKVNYGGKRVCSKAINETGTYFVGPHEVKRKN